MLSAALALIGALVYGSADFLGGMAARRMRSIVVTATAAITGLVVLLVLAPLVGGTWDAADLAWGALSGVAGVVAVGLLYACLAVGPMSILSPLTAVVSAIAPMTWGLLVEGEELGPTGYVGLAVALVAVVLVGFLPGEKAARPSLRGVLMAVGSGIAIGAFLIIVDQTGDDSGLMPLVANRAVNAAITCSVVGVLALMAVRAGRPAKTAFVAGPVRLGAAPSGHGDLEHATAHAPAGVTPQTRVWMLAAGCGILDTFANTLLLLALRSGDLAVVSALTALYPAGTIILAALVLRERIAVVQWVGLSLAVGAGALLAVG